MSRLEIFPSAPKSRTAVNVVVIEITDIGIAGRELQLTSKRIRQRERIAVGTPSDLNDLAAVEIVARTAATRLDKGHIRIAGNTAFHILDIRKERDHIGERKLLVRLGIHMSRAVLEAQIFIRRRIITEAYLFSGKRNALTCLL